MTLDPKKLAELKRLAGEGRGTACWHCGADLMATEGTSRVVSLAAAVPALITEVERLQLASEVVRCLRYVTCPHCGERYATPPGDCDLVDHLEAHQALVAVGAEALPRR